MLRKFSLVTAFMACIVYAQAQGIKFGVHVDPSVSFMNSNDKKVTAKGANFAFGLGVELEYYFSEGENYALSFGGNFAFSKGGTLSYTDGGKLLPKSTLDNSAYFNNMTTISASVEGQSGLDLPLVKGTSVKYNINYVEIPVGLKLRTNELGQSYMRAFFNIPVVTPMIAVSARGTVNAPNTGSSADPGYNTSEPSKGENIYKDVNFFQLMLGTGAGVEFSPNEEGGLRLVGGLFYNYGFIDAVKTNQTYDSVLNPLAPTYKDSKAVTGFHNISLRIGVIF